MFHWFAKRAMGSAMSRLDIDAALTKAKEEQVGPDFASRVILGLDLGQAADYTALAVLRQSAVEGFRRYEALAIKRWPLGTAYTEIVDAVGRLIAKHQLAGQDLVVDGTGVGRPVVDMIRKARTGANLRPVTITAGQKESCSDGYWHVPKVALISCTNMLLQNGRIAWNKDMPHVQTLVKELQNYRVKITASANESFNAREGAHDDLVLALALACWFGERGTRRLNIFC